MNRKKYTLFFISILTLSIFVGCNKSTQEETTNEIEIATPVETTTPTPYVDWNNPLEVAGVDGMGVSSEIIDNIPDKFDGDYSGIMDFQYDELNGTQLETTSYVNNNDEYKSYIETYVKFATGEDVAFSWIGETSMGSLRFVPENGEYIRIYNKEENKSLLVRDGFSITDEMFETYINTDLKSVIASSNPNANVDELYEEEKLISFIKIIYAIETKDGNNSYKGYRKIIIDKTHNEFVQFDYLVPIENFDTNAYSVISSIELRDKDDKLIDEIKTPMETPTNEAVVDETSETQNVEETTETTNE